MEDESFPYFFCLCKIGFVFLQKIIIPHNPQRGSNKSANFKKYNL